MSKNMIVIDGDDVEVGACDIFQEDEQAQLRAHTLSFVFSPKLLFSTIPQLLLIISCGLYDNLAISLVPVVVCGLCTLSLSVYARAEWRAWMYALFPCGGRCIVEKSPMYRNQSRFLRLFLSFQDDDGRMHKHDRVVHYDSNLDSFPLLQPGAFEILELYLTILLLSIMFAISRSVQPYALFTNGPLFPLCWVATFICGLTCFALGVAGSWNPHPDSVARIKSFLLSWKYKHPLSFALRARILKLAKSNVRFHNIRSKRLLVMLLLSMLFSTIFVCLWIYQLVQFSPTVWQDIKLEPAVWISVAFFIWMCSIATLESMRCLSVLDFDRLVSECLWRIQSLSLLLVDLRLIHALRIPETDTRILPLQNILSRSDRVIRDPNNQGLELEWHTNKCAVLVSNDEQPALTSSDSSSSSSPSSSSPSSSSSSSSTSVSPSAADQQAWLQALGVWRETRSVLVLLDTNYVFQAGTPLMALLLLEAAIMILALVYQVFASPQLLTLTNFTIVYGAAWNVFIAFFMAMSMLRVYKEYNLQIDLLTDCKQECTLGHGRRFGIITSQPSELKDIADAFADTVTYVQNRAVTEAPSVLGLSITPTLLNVMTGYIVTGVVTLAGKLLSTASS